MKESEKPLQQRNTGSFFEIFYVIMMQIRALDIDTSLKNVATAAADDDVFLEKWLKMIQPQKDSNDSDDEESAATDQGVDVDETVVELPQQIKLTVTILKRCIHNLRSPIRLDICLVLDTISVGLQVLSSWTDELLPIVHLLWPPFVQRCRDLDIVVNRKYFTVLMLLSELAKDFLYIRMKKYVELTKCEMLIIDDFISSFFFQ